MADGIPASLSGYQKHCDSIMKACQAHNFNGIEKIVSTYWASCLKKKTDGLDGAAAMEMVETQDNALYQGVIATVMPDVFQKMDPDVTKRIRTFAKNYVPWLTAAMGPTGKSKKVLPAPFVEMRLRLAVAFAQKLRRYTGLNHLAQAARAVLNNPYSEPKKVNSEHVKQMQEDYERIDFVNVQEQVAWVCEGCDVGLMSKHETEFRRIIMNQEDNCIERWAKWLQGIVADRLGALETAEKYEARASELLLRWSFISSLIIRDLTLRSARSFGPFHLLRLLCDEYMYFLVETAVAEGGCRSIEHTPGGEVGGASADGGKGAKGGAAKGGAKATKGMPSATIAPLPEDPPESGKKRPAESPTAAGDNSKRPKND